MNAIKIFCVGVALCLTSGYAMSQTRQGGNGSQTLDLGWLKAKCAELTGNEQLKPFAVTITCSSKSTYWKEAAERPIFRVPNTLEYGISAKMKGYQLPFRTLSDSVAPSQGACIIMEKWTRTVPEIETKKTCEEIMAVNSLLDLCKPFIEESLANNPSLALDEKTNERFNSCGANATGLIRK
jgi:hypothetical protein